jgi:aminopeptidase N
LRDSYAYEWPEMVVTTSDRETVGHEVAHQWFYGIVGDDQYREPWLDESFAAWNEEQVTPGTYDCDPNDPLIAPPGALSLGMEHYERVGFSGYERAVYDAGECALERLEQDLGRDAFLGLLAREVDRYRFGVVHTDQFLALIAEQSPEVAANWATLFGFTP